MEADSPGDDNYLGDLPLAAFSAVNLSAVKHCFVDGRDRGGRAVI